MLLQKPTVVNPQANIHPLAEVQSKHIGFDTNIWQFSVVLEGCVIGRNCNICAHTFIESDVMIGDNVTIKSGVYIWNGIRLEDDVFVGPSVVFTNGLRPRSKQYTKEGITIVKRGASLGAGTNVLTGITIGEYAMTGMGSVVTRDVPAHALVFGNPARIRGWVDKAGRKLVQEDKDYWKDEDSNLYLIKDNVIKMVRMITTA
ncbi:MAG: N-acetyltransferase [Chitinophagaceae bacterium]|nr:N-acetyltransferase [Chitinophagaceae bacterium]